LVVRMVWTSQWWVPSDSTRCSRCETGVQACSENSDVEDSSARRMSSVVSLCGCTEPEVWRMTAFAVGEREI
jgi:hypothetical protein